MYIFGLLDQAYPSDVADTRVYPEVSYRILLGIPLHFLLSTGLPDLKVQIYTRVFMKKMADVDP